jgi:hypothetical protein
MDFKQQAEFTRNFLKREAYIRYAGILFTLSPLGNFLWSSALAGYYHWYYPNVLWAIAQTVSGVLWFLWGSTFAAGLLMLKGKRSSWNFTLCIIGTIIIFNIISFKRDIQIGWFQPTLSLLINIGLFALIYTQEFHQRLEKKLRAARMTRPFSLAVERELQVHFEGLGHWARITEITNAGFRVRSVDGEAPRQIEFRTIEIAITRELVLRARFSAKIGPDFVFRFVQMNPSLLASLHRWAQKIASRTPSPAFKSPAA